MGRAAVLGRDFRRWARHAISGAMTEIAPVSLRDADAKGLAGLVEETWRQFA